MKNKVLFTLYFLLSLLYFTSLQAQDIEQSEMTTLEVVKDFSTNLILQTPFVSAYKAKKRINQIKTLVKTQYKDIKPASNLVDTEGFSYSTRVLEQ